MAGRRRDGHRADLYRRQGDHHADDCLGADRRAHHLDPHAARRRVRYYCAQDEADDLRAAAALAPANAAPADGPPAWKPA